MPRVSYEKLHEELTRVLLKKGFSEKRAEHCARLFAEASRDGIHSHGLNRFPRFIAYIDRGIVKVDARPRKTDSIGSLEQWDGQQGPGNLNAYQAMTRAITLSRSNGIGCVALRNTNHWMRGGSYGWQAADAGVIGICWSNTTQNMPPWGASESRVGNNPFIIAVPRSEGHIVLDMAMSQFSYGTLDEYKRKNKKLPVHGGFDEENQLTRDPTAILKSGRPLPAGFWKGSGLSLMLDLVGALLADGKAVHQISTHPMEESELTQVFLTVDLEQLYSGDRADQMANDIIDHLHGATVTENASGVYYPGEQTLQRRRNNTKNGIPVDEEIWEKVQSM
jgi:3-dehydro-L-gulonate 2-dehydrogenase